MNPRWRCTSCEVSAHFTDPERTESPAGWTEVGGEWRCLRCRRNQAAEAALAAGEVTSLPEGVARFELLRDADMANKSIANASKLPPYRVALMRRKLVGEGLIERQAPGPKPKAKDRHAELRQRIDTALRDEPSRANKAIAEAIGCSRRTVAIRRHRLEADGTIAVVTTRGFASRPYRGDLPRIAARGAGR